MPDFVRALRPVRGLIGFDRDRIVEARLRQSEIDLAPEPAAAARDGIASQDAASSQQDQRHERTSSARSAIASASAHRSARRMTQAPVAVAQWRTRESILSAAVEVKLMNEFADRRLDESMCVPCRNRADASLDWRCAARARRQTLNGSGETCYAM